MLILCHWWIIGLWAAFVIYWLSAGVFAEPGLRRAARHRSMALSFTLFGVVMAAAFVARGSAALEALQLGEHQSIWLAVTGAALATLGALIAFAARAVIGRNWGIPGTRKADTELVTNGPYKLIRHPIYSGILVMMAGSAIGLTPIWWLVAVAAAVYFVVIARAEESYMAERFPEAYPAYRARTKMLIPFLL